MEGSEGRPVRRPWVELLARASAWALPPVILCAVGWASTLPTGAYGAPPAPLAIPREPSIPAGESLYGSECAGCHADRGTFAGRSWRASLTPAEVARMLLGKAQGHPAAVAELGRAWDAAAFVWTLPDDGTGIRRGESLAFEASDALRSDVLSVALLHWNDLQNLKSASWVLNHTADDVDTLMRRLAGARYTNLPARDRQDLIDYVFASFFAWPGSW